MFLKIKKQNNKTKNKVSNYVFNSSLRKNVHNTGTSQTDLMCKSVDWFLYNRQALQGKWLIIITLISNNLQLVHLPVFRDFGFKGFCVWFAFDRAWNLIPKMGSTENKSVCPVFRAYGFRKV